MATPTLTSISPTFGPPGTSVTLTGSGFDAGAQMGCPALQATTWNSATELVSAIPADLAGSAGTSQTLGLFVRNEDGSTSAIAAFTLRFGETWTDVEKVCGEVPQFRRGGTITDAMIDQWIWSIAQSVNACMLARGLSLDPDDWQAADAVTLQPSPAAVLELIVRYGAAARLAAVIGGQFSAASEWSLAKTLRADYERELKALANGAYDKLFKSAAATAETGALVGGGDTESETSGEVEPLFTKDQVF